MLETFFVDARVRARLRDGPLGAFVEKLAIWLASERYTRAYARRALCGAAKFSRWVHEQGLSIESADEVTAARYAEEGGRRFKGRSRCRWYLGVLHLVRLLRREGVLGVRQEEPPSPLDIWLASFDSYLEGVVGLALTTRKNRVGIARRLAAAHLGNKPAWSSLTPESVVTFVREEASARKDSAGGTVVGVRSVLKYLVAEGHIRPGLIDVVPSVRKWRHASLPRFLTADELDRVFQACSKETSVDVRDRAILLLLARLGLRAIEVVRLRLADLDWHEGTVRVSATKTARDRVLPIPHDVGNAMITYLQVGRPATGFREVFVTMVRPFRPLTSMAVTSLARKHLQAAGVSVNRLGAHVFRHSAATHMVRRGASFKEVADVLGHKDLATTGIYAKLNMEMLTRMAMPWPGGEQ